MKPPPLGTLLRALGRRDGSDTPPAPPHSFREKAPRRGGPCAVCAEPLGPQGLSCRVCKLSCHKRCEGKVTSPCQAPPPPEQRRGTAPTRRSEHVGSTKSLSIAPQRNTLPRSLSQERQLRRGPGPGLAPGLAPDLAPGLDLDLDLDLDLRYVSERVLSLRFPPALPEPRHRQLLRHVAQLLLCRHRDQYMIFNLSEKRRDLARLNPRVQDFGWPDPLAPPLDKLCCICKALEGWLRGQPQRLAVLHCKGSKGKAGVIVAAYMHYSQVTASAEQALSTLSMRKFCEEKVAMQPSQRRAVELFGALLSGRQRLSSSPVFLQHVLLPALPGYGAHGCRPFLKIYQALQLVYTSGVYSPGPRSLCISLEPALLLKGDVLVTCYHRQLGGREPVFRAQFHTGTLRGGRLRLPRGELDLAWEDERFPPEGSVEFVFSAGPERIQGWAPPGAPPAPVDYGVLDPTVRRDSYEGFGLRHQDSLEELLLDSSPYQGGQRPRRPWSPGGGPPSPDPPSPDPPSPEPAPGRPPPPTAAERQELERLLGGFGVRGGPQEERETPILGDEPGGTPPSHGMTASYGSPMSYGSTASLGSPASHGTTASYGNTASYGSPASLRSPTSYGSPASHGSTAPYGSPTSHGTLTSYGSIAPYGTTASLGSPTSYGTPMPQRTPTPHGSPMSHGSPASHGTTAPYGTPTSHGTPTSYGTPAAYSTPTPQGTPTSYGTPTSPGSPTPYGTLTSLGTTAPYGTPTSHGTPTSYGSPVPQGTPTLYGTTAPYGTLTPHGTPTSHGSPTSHESPASPGTTASYGTTAPYGTIASPGTIASYGTTASYGIPASHGTPASYGSAPPHGPPLCRRASLAPPCSCRRPPSPEAPRDGGGLPAGGGGRRGVQRSLSEGPPPLYGLGGGAAWGAPPRPPVPPPEEPPPCPHCGRPGLGLSWSPPPRAPPGKAVGEPPGLETPQQEPNARRSPGVGLPWRPPPESPEPPPGSSPTPAFPPPALYHPPSPSPSPAPPPPAPGGPRSSPPPQQLAANAGGSGDPPGAGAPPPGGSFVQDTSKFWFKPGLSRERAVALLQREAPGSFLIRQSSSFRGAFGLALRVGEPPPRCPPGRGDPQEQLVRHFLIETGPRGVKIKGSPEEPHFGSLPALVLHHSISPISLPCALRIPTKDPLEDTPEGPVPPNMSTAAELLRQGAACRVLYVGSAGTESLTGPPAVAKAVGSILGDPARAPPGPVHFKVTAQGITLTDTERRLFFRRHYPTGSITHCSTDPQDRRWVNPDGTTSKIFGFVARQWGGPGGSNSCHLFAELDPEQPAGAIVTFITKVLLGTRRQ